MSLTSTGNLVVPSDINYTLTCNFNSSIRGVPYIEIVIQKTKLSTFAIVYNSVLYNLSQNDFLTTTSNASELIIPTSSAEYYALINVNDNRVYTCDNYLSYEPKSKTQPPTNLYFKYANSNGCMQVTSNRAQPFPTTSTNSKQSKSQSLPYTVESVDENSIYYYYSNKVAYLLIDYNNSLNTSYGFTIYIMQSYCTQVTKDINSSNLNMLYDLLIDESLVGSGNTLPSNWTYSSYNIPNSAVLQSVSVGTIYKTRDGLSNAYIYVNPTYCNKLYEATLKTSPTKIAESNITTTATFRNQTTSSSSSGTSTLSVNGYNVSDTLNAGADAVDAINSAISSLSLPTSGTGTVTTTTTIHTSMLVNLNT
jgi:hypothetical protein